MPIPTRCNACVRIGFVTAFMLSCVAATAAEDTLRRGLLGPPGSLDQHLGTTVVESQVLHDLYEGLTRHDGAGRLMPGAAREWSVSADGLSYTFHLRPDGRWSNGDRVTAHDFVGSFRRALDPATAAPYAHMLHRLRNAREVNEGRMAADALGVRAVDDMTLRFDLEAPTTYFPELLSNMVALPLHMPSLREHGRAFTRPGNMVTNGAYKLKTYRANRPVELLRSSTFRDRDRVAVERVRYVPLLDSQNCARRFEAGEIDICPEAPSAQIDGLRERLGSQVRVAATIGQFNLAYNTKRPPFDRAEVRKALSLVLDRNRLAGTVLRGVYRPATRLVPPNVYPPGVEVRSPLDDPAPPDARMDSARRLLATAGYGPNRPLTFDLAYMTSIDVRLLVEAIAATWRPLGVRVRLRSRDLSAHFAMLQDERDFDLALAGWLADYRDAQNFLFLHRSDNLAFNYAGYADEHFDRLLDEANGTVDPEERARLLARAEELLLASHVTPPLLYLNSVKLVSRRVGGWVDNDVESHPSRDLSLSGSD